MRSWAAKRNNGAVWTSGWLLNWSTEDSICSGDTYLTNQEAGRLVNWEEGGWLAGLRHPSRRLATGETGLEQVGELLGFFRVVLGGSMEALEVLGHSLCKTKESDRALHFCSILEAFWQ